MICGFPPFHANNREVLFNLIKKAHVSYPNDISPESIDFLSKIFVVDPKKRLGSKGAKEVKEHPFFAEMDWVAIYNKKIKPPFEPRISKKEETRYVHREFTDEDAVDSYHKGETLNSKDDKFVDVGFSYEKENNLDI